ncbi:MAG: acylphosphatase [Solirubrobacteraceae bacterium]
MTGVVARVVVVSGVVQGVFFRDGLRREARRQGVCGWARNRADGRVEARLEGQADAVAQVVLWCRSGSLPARVENLEVSEVAPEGLDGFVIG